MDLVLVVSAAVAGLLAAALLARAAGVAQLRRMPWAHLSVAALLLLSVDWARGDWPAWQVGATFVAWVVVLATFPDGRAQPRRMRWLVVAYAAVVGFRVSTDGTFEELGWALILLGGVLLAGASQIWRYRRRSSVAEREATRWVVLGFLLSVTLLLAGDLAGLTATPAPGTWWWEVGRSVGLLLPTGAALGLLAPQRVSVDPLVRWSLVAGGLVLGLIATYVLTVPVLGPGWSAALVAGLVTPLGHGLRKLAERLVYGAEAQPALARLGDRLEDSVDPDDVAQTVADAVRSGLSVPYAAVTVDPAATAEAGTATDESALEPFPVSYQGRRVATIAVAPRAGEAALTPRDRVVLQRLARRAGAALHGAGVVAELRAARERLVLAREEERRRIRRDLHDDLAPTLAGLGMSVAAASSFARTDPARAQSLAAELQEGIRRAAVQIREIAYDLRPPELDDHGLVATLRHRVCHTSPGDPLTVAVSAPGERLPLPAAVEIAALRIVQEAVANARRHSDATRCDVTLRTADGQLTIDVSDDGRGIAPGTTMGIGLRSIEERADELGGRSELTSGPSGTTLRVALPTQWARR